MYIRRFRNTFIIFFISFLLIPFVHANCIFPSNDKNYLCSEIDSEFMVGIMYVFHVKKGWGWEQRWLPISIFRNTNNNWDFIGPSSGYFLTYDFDGLIGPRYRIHSHFVKSGSFFICANVKVWEELFQ
jgi:hypothetical protein